MKKIAKMMLVFATAFLLLTGCSSKSYWKLSFNSGGIYTLISCSRGLVDLGWQEVDPENPETTTTAQFSIKEDGEYNVVVTDEAGSQYTITMIFTDGKAEVKTDDGISVDLVKK